MKLKNLNVLITGANRGIGLALAQRIAKEKCHLHLLVRKFEQSLIDDLSQKGALSVTLWIYDLSEKNQVTLFLQESDKHAFDVLINNAGLLTGGLIEEQKFSEIEKMLQVNLHAPIQITQHLIPKMLRNKKGKIINNASVSALMHFPGASTYAAAKAGIYAFTNCIALELKDTGVTTLNLITPGVKTRMFDDIEVKYGKNLDVPQDHISAEEYAELVIEAINDDREVLYPIGATKWGLGVAHYLPSVFKKYVTKKFHR